MWRPAATDLKEADLPPLPPPVPATHADGAECAPIQLIPECAANAGTQTLSQLCGHARDVFRIAPEGMPITPKSQVNAVSLKSDSEGLDRGAHEDHDHLSLAVCLFTTSQLPGLP